MTYATQQDLIDRFGLDEIVELSDRQGVGVVDATVVARVLADADADINIYVAAKYTLPLSSTPLVLQRIAADIARYYLYDDKATQQVTQRYQDAVSQLKQIAAGTLDLGLDQTGTAQPQAGSVAVTANDRVFAESTLSDY